MTQIGLNDENYLAVSKYYHHIYMSRRISEDPKLHEEVRRLNILNVQFTGLSVVIFFLMNIRC